MSGGSGWPGGLQAGVMRMHSCVPAHQFSYLRPGRLGLVGSGEQARGRDTGAWQRLAEGRDRGWQSPGLRRHLAYIPVLEGGWLCGPNTGTRCSFPATRRFLSASREPEPAPALSSQGRTS